MSLKAKLQLNLVLLCTILYLSCSVNLTPEVGQAAIKKDKPRFAYWKDYDLYADTAALTRASTCEGKTIDCILLVQKLFAPYKKETHVDRPIIKRNLKPLYDVAQESDSLSIDLLINQEGNLDAYRYNYGLVEAHKEAALHCVANYQFQESVYTTCLEKRQVYIKNINLDASRRR